ncbi:F0F1 ATP synthase subunit delta [Candidatus Fokinia crypta]|uniref:ATP synthase subunit delta n=1 Tax=Candidatus Fokinia crypta TaxID=1920990 RepID=A0ABZ0US17_9RICK|nr:F0F1 ATP synthase subunit delta [Candidatus Fokinia cryptica]WPX97814.1 ATP synthase subunit delta [Candidatus Fokinia cryptica]
MNSLYSVPSYIKKLSDVFCNNTSHLLEKNVISALDFLNAVLDITRSSIYLSRGFSAIHAPKSIQKSVGELVIHNLVNHENSLNDVEHGLLEELKHFIYLLIDRKMLPFMYHFIQFAINKFYKLANLRRATIFTTRPVNDDTKAHLVKSLSEAVDNNSIVPTFLIDDSMIGGFRIESDFLLIDKSIASKILAAKKQLTKL